MACGAGAYTGGGEYGAGAGATAGVCSAFRRRPPSTTAPAPIAAPAQRLLTAWGSPASAALGMVPTSNAPITATTRIFRIDALLPERFRYLSSTVIFIL